MALLNLSSISNDITYPLIGGGIGAIGGLLFGSSKGGVAGKAMPEAFAIGGALVGGAVGWVIAQKTSNQTEVPKISANATQITLYDNGSVGPSTIAITGSGFSSSSTAYFFWVENGTTTACGQANSGVLGNINGTITTSAMAATAGTGYIVVQDASTLVYSNQISLTAKNGSTPPPSGAANLTASVSSLTGLPANITVGGSSFYSLENDIKLYAYSNGNPANVVTLGYTTISCGTLGDFSNAPVSIPAVSGATSITIYAQGNVTGLTTNAVTISINAPVTYNAILGVNPTSVAYSPSGSQILTFSGSGFPAFANDILLISTDNNGTTNRISYSSPISAGPLGNFTIQGQLPAFTNATSYSVYAQGQQSGVKTNTLTIPVTGAPGPASLSLSAYVVSLSSTRQLIITGTGFPANSTGTLKASSSTVSPITMQSIPQSNSSGTFINTLTFPGGVLYDVIQNSVTIGDLNPIITITATVGNVSTNVTLLGSF